MTRRFFATDQPAERMMKRASDQLLEEATYPNLAALLRSGGTLEVGEDLSVGAFTRIRKGNQTVTVDTAYSDFAAVLKEMEAKAKDFLNRETHTRR